MPFLHTQKVLFRHCDPAGIVFYPRYFEMINDCVEAYFADIGFPFEDLHRSAAVPTAQIDTEFHAPSRHGDSLTFSLALTKIGGASLGIAITAEAAAEARLSTTLTLVHINTSGRPVRWPDPMRTAFQSNLRNPT